MCVIQPKELNPVHTQECKDKRGKYSIDWSHNNLDGSREKVIIETDCEDTVIVFSYGFKIHYMNVGSCVLQNYKQVDIIKMAVEHLYNVELIPFRNHAKLPKWEGEDYVYELVSFGNIWDYYTKTSIDKIADIFASDLDKELMGEYFHKTYKRVASYCGKEQLLNTAYSLTEQNLENLKRNEFISKRATHYEITQADINYILKKLNNQTNNKTKKKNGVKN